MSNEATVRTSLEIRKGNKDYRSQPTAFLADVEGYSGPTPGTFTVLPSGTHVDLSQLTEYGLCRIQNMDDTNWVDYGIFDDLYNRFFPIHRILPGESYITRLSPDLGQVYDAGVSTGTGTSGAGNGILHMRSYNQPVLVNVEAHDA